MRQINSPTLRLIATFILILLGPFAIARASSLCGPLHFVNERLCAHYSWKVGPQSENESQMWVEFIDEQTLLPRDPPAFEVSLFMPDMGHGSSPTSITKTPTTGKYLVDKIFFIMPGSWDVLLKVGSETKRFAVEI